MCWWIHKCEKWNILYIYFCVFLVFWQKKSGEKESKTLCKTFYPGAWNNLPTPPYKLFQQFRWGFRYPLLQTTVIFLMTSSYKPLNFSIDEIINSLLQNCLQVKYDFAGGAHFYRRNTLLQAKYVSTGKYVILQGDTFYRRDAFYRWNTLVLVK